MKKKTDAKTVRFNIEHLQICMSKTGFASYQQLVDFLIDEYSRGDFKNARELPKSVQDVPKKELSSNGTYLIERMNKKLKL